MNKIEIDTSHIFLYNSLSVSEKITPVPSITAAVIGSRLQHLFKLYHTELLVVTEHNIPVGTISYRKVSHELSTQFGYALYERRSVIELMTNDFLCLDTKTKLSEVVHQALQRSSDTMYDDIVVVKDGFYVGLLSIARLLLEQRNEIIHVVEQLEINKRLQEKINADLEQTLTHLQNTEAQLIQSEKMASIGTLSAGIAHDFNNMLGVIMASTQIMQMKLPSESPLLKYCQTIENATARSAGLTKQLLEFGQKNMLSAKVISLNSIVKETLQLLERSIDKNITITLNLEDSISFVEVDATQIQQVIMNLAINARDAMPMGGTLTFRTSETDIDEAFCQQHVHLKPGRYVQFDVEDTGSGIPESVVKKIFDPFFTTKDVGKGSGLGLSVVYGIITKHNGYILVRTAVGKGTCFTIFIKPSQGAMRMEGKKETMKTSQTGNETILLVDDERMVLELNAELLESMGYRTIIAISGNDALEIYKQRKHEIDLVLLDMIMPGMDGKETFFALQQEQPDIKAFFISGYGMEEKFKLALERGALGLIQKPINIIEMSRRLANVFNKN